LNQRMKQLQNCRKRGQGFREDFVDFSLPSFLSL
jgi:hypothetical protein